MTDHLQHTSIINLTTDPAISFAQDGDTWSIFPLVPPVVISSLGDAVVSTHNDNTLNNFAGSTIAGLGTGGGVSFSGNNGAITNYSGAKITGDIAILVAGSLETINNSGTVGSLDGSYGVKFGTASNLVTLTNYAGGTISGHQAGILAFSDHEGGHIVNAGSILSDIAGIQVQTFAGAQTFIDNTGTIGGDVASIRSAAGAIHLYNAGILSDEVDLNGAGSDIILNHGQIAGQVFLGDGNDQFTGFQGNSGEVFGEAGKDRLIGSNHADLLNGGFGKDTLTGGLGADYFDFDTSADSTVGGQHDVITDFRRAQHDRIDLSGIDSNGALPGDPQFGFRGIHGFTHAGQIRYVLQDHAGTAHDKTIIFGNIDADKAPEFQIEVKSLVHFHAGDFIL